MQRDDVVVAKIDGIQDHQQNQGKQQRSFNQALPRWRRKPVAKVNPSHVRPLNMPALRPGGETPWLQLMATVVNVTRQRYPWLPCVYGSNLVRISKKYQFLYFRCIQQLWMMPQEK
jgi:hypothetical protein